MSHLLNSFEVFNKIPENIKQNISIFHIFDDFKGYNVLYITNDDRVFGFGSNCSGCLGLGHNRAVNEPQIINELRFKNIKQFINGSTFVLALSENKRIYGWGYNKLAQLGRGYKSDEYLKPDCIDILNDKNIIQISCGSCHSLALTSEGVVYGWGINEKGEIGCGGNEDIIDSPKILNTLLDYKIKSIYCSFLQSFALTFDGLVFSWGHNKYHTLGHVGNNGNIYIPKLINISNVISVILCCNNTYFLTNEGMIYFCGYYINEENLETFQLLPKLFETDIRFESIYSIPNYQELETITTGLSGNAIYLIDWNIISKTKYNNYFDYYANECEMTYKSIIFSENNVSNDDSFENTGKSQPCSIEKYLKYQLI